MFSGLCRVGVAWPLEEPAPSKNLSRFDQPLRKSESLTERAGPEADSETEKGVSESGQGDWVNEVKSNHCNEVFWQPK